MSETLPENPAASAGGTYIALKRVKADKDIHAGLFTLKRVFIQVVVSLLSFVMATGTAFLAEKWLHFIGAKMEESDIPIAPLFKTALPYISGALMIGLSVIATYLAFREAWHLGRRSVDAGSHAPVAPVDSSSPSPQKPPQDFQGMSRAERRRQNRR